MGEGCLYDGTAEVQELTDEEVADLRARVLPRPAAETTASVTRARGRERTTPSSPCWRRIRGCTGWSWPRTPPGGRAAGIGITGPAAQPIVFGSWRRSVPAHLGRLLAYALPLGAGTAEQAALIEEALAWRPIPAQRRGVAARLSGLAGTWAADTAYASKLAQIAEEIRSAQVN